MKRRVMKTDRVTSKVEEEPGLPSLDKFIKEVTVASRNFPINAYTRWGTLTVYVRVGPRYLDGTLYEHVIDIANVTADVPGKGAFTRLVQHLRSTYPTFSLYVECVLSARFEAGLERLGFVHTEGHPHCLHMLGDVKNDL